MIRTNLSTRPFYDERPVQAALVLAAVLMAALSLVNGWQVLSRSEQQTTLTLKTAADEARAEELARETGALRRQIDDRAIEAVAAAAYEANTLIDRRIFSWTALFDHLETTLPPGAMLTSIRPDVRDGHVWITMVVIARRVADIDTFIERLEGTGAFTDLLSRQEEMQLEGTYRTTLEGRYRPLREDEATLAAPSRAPEDGRTERRAGGGEDAAWPAAGVRTQRSGAE